MPRLTNRFDGSSPNPPSWHAHGQGQVIVVEAGLSHLRTEHGAWIIPARSVAWVPPGVRHLSRASGGSGWVLIPPVVLRELPAKVCVLRASALMTAALQRLTQLEPAADRRMRSLLWSVLAAEMRAAQPEPLKVPMPTAPRILKAVQSVLTKPTATASLDRLAARAGMSRRSFARHFRGQTGLSYSKWKRMLIAQYALGLVVAGHKVSSVALEVGYESVSAFIAMFRQHYGETPRQFASTL
jgi:AraC-like DNA-binding protein